MAYLFEGQEWHVKTGAGTWSLLELAKTHSRPFYLYDLDDVAVRVESFKRGPATHIHYAMKANSNPRLLGLLRDEGLGVDVVSLGELQKALSLGFHGQKIIFSGVGKDSEELNAAMRAKIFQINCESVEELKLLAEVAALRGEIADIGLRLNIHLEAPTHKNIQTATEESKFGIDVRDLNSVLALIRERPSVRLRALAVHIGSQILDVSVFQKMSVRMGELFREVKAAGFSSLTRLDLGGGLGIDYTDLGEGEFSRLEDYHRALTQHGTDAELALEPGRFLVARMGALLARVVYVKRGREKSFVILNAGMTCLMRPALYQAFHRIETLKSRPGDRVPFDVVGPICESTDVFAEARMLPPIERGDWLAVFDAGAYGAVMASTYNETPRPEEWTLLKGVLEIG